MKQVFGVIITIIHLIISVISFLFVKTIIELSYIYKFVITLINYLVIIETYIINLIFNIITNDIKTKLDYEIENNKNLNYRIDLLEKNLFSSITDKRKLNIQIIELKKIQSDNENKLIQLSLQQNIDNDINKCSICYEHNISKCCIPCGHTYCNNCITITNNCYICRSRIQQKINIYI